LDFMILEVFSNLSDSMKCKGWGEKPNPQNQTAIKPHWGWLCGAWERDPRG